MRKQYHFRPGASGLDAWDVDRIVALAADQPRETVPLAEIREIDETYWYDHGYRPTVRSIVEHAALIQQAALDHPIVLDPDGRVMDGMHRIARALLDGRTTITVVRLATMPEPDFTDCRQDDLPYD